ncbi:MAG: S1 family peptidase [Marivivens sp.]|nr:S1 family peptidase [Marivivens sp.]
MRLIVLFIALMLGATSVAAQDGRLVTLSTSNDGRGWEAVGRLDIAGKGFCTAALIRDDLILTAAHCVYDRDGRPIEAGRFSFGAGLREGRAEAYRNIRRVVAHPNYRFGVGTTGEEVARDLALLELDQPIRTTRIFPYPIAATPRAGDQVGVVSYARGREDAPSLQEICDVLGRQDGVVVMTCDVNFGASGSPVFRVRNGVAEIVSVVSAMTNLDGTAVSLGASLDQPLSELLAYYDMGAQSILPRAIMPGQRGDTGAKFIRP